MRCSIAPHELHGTAPQRTVHIGVNEPWATRLHRGTRYCVCCTAGMLQLIPFSRANTVDPTSAVYLGSTFTGSEREQINETGISLAGCPSYHPASGPSHQYVRALKCTCLNSITAISETYSVWPLTRDQVGVALALSATHALNTATITARYSVQQLFCF